MSEKFMEIINKKAVYMSLILGTVLLLVGVGFGTYYFVTSMSNTKSSAVVARPTASKATTTPSADDSDLETSLKTVDTKASSLDGELNTVNTSLNDTQTNLAY